MKRFCIAAAVMGMAMLASSSSAELNVPVATRVLSFLQPPASGLIVAAIVFAPGNAASLADAAAIERAIGNGVTVGKATVRARRVPVGSLSSLAGARVAFVTAGLRGEQDGIAQAAVRAQTVTITADQACVAAGRCVVGIETSPRVQITVNRAAARSVNAKFGSAFLMLVKEI